MFNFLNIIVIFETKKIQTETLSEYLSQVRKDLGLSAEHVSQKTGIGLKILTALESGQLKVLPADVYVFGFLRQLADLYAIEPVSLINQYKKEKTIQQQVVKQSQGPSGWYRERFGKIVITPKLLSVVLGLSFIIISVAYIIWQVWSINKIPYLQISQPQNNITVMGSSVEVQGKTDPGMSVTVNGQNIFVDADGSFKTQLGLNPGPEQIVVTAINRFNKSLSQTINVIGQATTTPLNASSIELKIDFNAAVTLSYVIDDQPQQTLSFNKGDSKSFTADREILISTSDAGATKVTLNGQPLGAMGRPGEALSSVPFMAPANSTSTK